LVKKIDNIFNKFKAGFLYFGIIFFNVSDPYEDQFEKRVQKKKESTAKNEYQRLRNIAQHKNVKSKP
jgi:hypothetical protein